MILKDYTEEQIKNLVEIIKECVRENKYTISLDENKMENLQFIEEYNINEKKRISILCDLDYKDFCYGVQNMKNGIEQNDLYVFCRQKELYNIEDKRELIYIYMKFNVIWDEFQEYRVLVSLHKRNKASSFLFKQD
ncbi:MULTISPECIES: hypothetical protein [Clostridium]|uniref:Uncharacterized protein n=1 Tax=Clostridium saccharoperbutylacetonicum N1-4(HMT) TaxID=931276 RepID=M1LU07_9CLOT|nr:hypothetical protein [Clostridium saccharoperbutylacetonicum]AGF56540.1 hypothetical protein Cspa_c27770 [Clostridium saccharoperbutylacetonicum N1-4(HMT)]AQR95214.1 hypothetical protein CLSAP_25300 [Clostridium saccharoperbutylacetonicum]NRT62709.1 UDP-N-acetylglucosamine 2-epimerase [Clostridium saccharoperbutylacetonicum]NSB26060.1 UDP-N-acetylglucosamine 2-epimerase [Clostridium saccharoperbutylacetonicum]NSB31068.1 UDP-N-acetylglucosamine 2-epimerase [Clostridium saccharoperbutylaceton